MGSAWQLRCRSSAELQCYAEGLDGTGSSQRGTIETAPGSSLHHRRAAHADAVCLCYIRLRRQGLEDSGFFNRSGISAAIAINPLSSLMLEELVLRMIRTIVDSGILISIEAGRS